ncbi:hypothetical protein Fot_49154 [Forsythia ovata]|uniref:Uncharacterized protein n=1 Tax=Forsythia ovata TaxID=205694 RepID=A0ABD1QB21_9LAMI
MVRNPSFPQPNLLSADELFSGGVLLPLHSSHDPPHPISQPPLQDPQPSGSDKLEPETEPELSSTVLANLSATSPFTSSKRWKDIFKKSDKKNSKSPSNANAGDSKNEKKKEKKGGGAGCGSNGVSTAELNITLWPFSRSGSAGSNGNRPRVGAGSAAATRKVISAPCSRSNSAGESKTSKKCPSSPSRAGLHLGRSSPVWYVRRGSSSGGGVIERSSDAMLKSSSTEKSAEKVRNDGRWKIYATSKKVY